MVSNEVMFRPVDPYHSYADEDIPQSKKGQYKACIILAYTNDDRFILVELSGATRGNLLAPPEAGYIV